MHCFGRHCDTSRMIAIMTGPYQMMLLLLLSTISALELIVNEVEYKLPESLSLPYLELDVIFGDESFTITTECEETKLHWIKTEKTKGITDYSKALRTSTDKKIATCSRDKFEVLVDVKPDSRLYGPDNHGFYYRLSTLNLT